MIGLLYEDFHDKFDAFEKSISKITEELHSIPWVRMDRAVYNHKRVREFSIWYMVGGQEFGHVFLARATQWDGKVDLGKIAEILQNHNLAIGPFEDIKVWDLANLDTQEKPRPRCEICGLFKE